MKKIYSFLLLSTLLLLGAQNVWAGNYLKGSWDGWSSATELIWAGDNATASITLSANTKYTFKMQDTGVDGNSDNWYGNNGTIAYSVSNWTFSTSEGDCTLNSGPAGTYTFKLTWNGSPKISVTFPDGSNTYTISFKLNGSWSNVYVYAYSGEGTFPAKKEQLGSWPGTPVTVEDGIYSVTFSVDNAPENVIWNNNDDSQTGDLTFVNYAIYNNSGVISYSLTPTNVEDNYYATFYGPYNVKLPTGVTAYKGELAGSTLTLNAFNSDVVPANTPVILKASSSSAFNVTATTAAAGTASGSNNLAGKLESTDVSGMTAEIGTGTLCVLGINAGNVGFYHFSGSSLAANRAYLIVPGASPAAGIRFVIAGEDNATGVQNVEANETAVKFIENGKLLIRKNGVVYDATGCVVR